MTILHGDDRIYNNIFIQQYPVSHPDRKPVNADYEVVGTACFDIFPTYEEWFAPFSPDEAPNMGALATAHFGHLPVWINGNAYFNGADIYAKESHFLENKKAKIKVDLVEHDGCYTLKTNVYTHLKDFRNQIITSDLLGKAFEPEQRFENPDGTDIVFTDYFGAPRGIDTIPGPFAEPEEIKSNLW